MAHSVSTNGRLSPWTGRRASAGNTRLRLLVVDDNPNSAYALVAYLSLEDIECSVAFGGKEAGASAITHDPHVVLMDISMPECNGYEAARALRRHPRTRDVVIVAHTALDERDVRREQNDDDFDGYLQKGDSPRRVVAMLHMLAQ
jgi:CheY-like chemotaxis protein